MKKRCLVYTFIKKDKSYTAWGFQWIIFFCFAFLFSFNLFTEETKNPAVTWYLHTVIEGKNFNRLAITSMTEGWIGLDQQQLTEHPLFFLKGDQWSQSTDFEQKTFRTHVLDATSPENVWVVGYGPFLEETYYGLRINRFNGQEWTHRIISEGIWPQCIKVVSGTEAWVGGNSATILHLKGDDVTRTFIPIPRESRKKQEPLTPEEKAADEAIYEEILYGSHIFDIVMNENNTGWAVGSMGFTARYENGEWQVISLPEEIKRIRLYGADFAPDKTLWAVGEQGIILRYREEQWEILPSPVENNLKAIDMVADNDGWIVGDGGTILRYNGLRWESHFSPTKNSLYDIQMISSRKGWISGDGVILKSFDGDLNIFQDKSEQKNPDMDRVIATHLTSLDITGDGRKDLFFLPRRFLYKNEGKSIFSNISSRTGLAELDGQYITFAWGDVDNDYDLDLYLISNKKDDNKLFINKGNGFFEPHPDEMQWGGEQRNSCSFLDIDNDNDLDIYISRYYESEEVLAEDYIYYNNGFGRFTLKKTGLGITSQRLVLWGDLDGDLDLDAIFPRLDEGLILYRNKGKGEFENVAKESGILDHLELGNFSQIAALFDADLDGDLDLMVLINTVYLFFNDGKGHFPEVKVFEGMKNYSLVGKAMGQFCSDKGDINNDGREDFLIKTNNSMGEPVIYLFIGEEDGSYLDIAEIMGIKNIEATQVLLDDQDDDGDLDLYITRGESGRTSLYYENQLNNSNYLYVQPLGVFSNSMAIGAQIRIYEAGHLNETGYLRGHKHVGVGGNSWNMHNIGKIHFGLDSTKKYDIEVRFPSGKRVVKRNAECGRTCKIYDAPLIIMPAVFVYKSVRRVMAFMHWPVEILKFLILLFFVGFARFFLAPKIGAGMIIKRWYVPVILVAAYPVLAGYMVEFNRWYIHLFTVTGYMLLILILVFLDRFLTLRKKSRYVGHYRMVKLLAEGGMGQVFEALDVIKKTRVALKILHPRVIENESNKQRFLREGKIMEGLDHPHIVRVLETGAISSEGFICMEYLEGITFGRMIKEQGPFDPDFVLHITLPVCRALAYIHKKGIVHRDIKSENIFILTRGQAMGKPGSETEWGVKLMDFGLAHSRDFISITHTESVIGTLAYMAPEHFSGDPIDPRTDIYSLGIVLYEALSGRLPHQGAGELGFIREIMKSEYCPVSRYNPGVTQELDGIIRKMLARKQEERYQYIDEVITALSAAGKKTPAVRETPVVLSLQGMEALSRGDIKEALTLSGEAVNQIHSSNVLSLKTSIFYNHYKILKKAQKETEGVLEQALDCIARQQKLFQTGEESQLIKEYTVKEMTGRWKDLYSRADELWKIGDPQGARDYMIRCFKEIHKTICLLGEDQKENYRQSHNLDAVLAFMKELLSV